MNKIINILKLILPKWIKKPIKLLKLRIDLHSARPAIIVKGTQIGKIIKNIREEGETSATLAKVHNFIRSNNIDFYLPSLDIMEYNNMTVFSESDFIFNGEVAVWGKFNLPQFTKITPIDQDLLLRKENKIYIKKPKNIVKVDIGFSLCGVHSMAWSHFVVQYLPKLTFIKDIKSYTDKQITVILPFYSDNQVREIVYGYVEKISNVKIIELKSNEVAVCDTLYHIENTAWLSESIKDIAPTDGIVSDFVVDSLNEILLPYFTEIDESEESSTSNKKLFIVREGIRNIIDYDKIETYFSKKGYKLVKPHNSTLLEKIKLYRNATHIVGPLSGGFTNLFFCRKGTKALVFSSYQRCLDTYLGYFSEKYSIDVTVLVGQDLHKNDISSSFIIPIDEIKSVSETLGY